MIKRGVNIAADGVQQQSRLLQNITPRPHLLYSLALAPGDLKVKMVTNSKHALESRHQNNHDKKTLAKEIARVARKCQGGWHKRVPGETEGERGRGGEVSFTVIKILKI